MSDRNWDDPKYKKARFVARKRDKFKCRKCGSKIKIQVHHIRPYHNNPSLLSDVNNLISLCKSCHVQMKNNEDAYISMCLNLINPKGFINIKRMLWELKNESGQ